MKISQVLNNNVALVKRGTNQVIIVSKGIGFKKKKGDTVDESEIEETYILDSYDMLERFSYLLSHSEPDDIIMIKEIISKAETNLGFKASDYLSLTLLDHLEFLLERAGKKQFIASPLVWDVKRFYPNHFQMGLAALKIIEEQKNLTLPQDEAVSLALHFINMEDNRTSNQERIEEMKSLAAIVSIVEKHFQIELDDESTNYMRFTTHLQYFIQRVMEKESYKQEIGSIDLYQQVAQLYPKSFQAVQKIKIYIDKQFEVGISISEETYLMLHINRVTNRMEEET